MSPSLGKNCSKILTCSKLIKLILSVWLRPGSSAPAYLLGIPTHSQFVISRFVCFSEPSGSSPKTKEQGHPSIPPDDNALNPIYLLIRVVDGVARYRLGANIYICWHG